MRTLLKAAVLLLLLASCGHRAELPPGEDTGPDPALPAPSATLLPTISVATAVGWPAGATPVPAPGLAVAAFATGLDHPRWLHVLPNGDVLVAESNAPARPAHDQGLKGWAFERMQKIAGAGVPSADRITLLRDADGDGSAEVRTTFLAGLHSPFGMALVGGDLYVANTDAVLRFPYAPGATRIGAQGVEIAALPAGPINHHWTKNIIASLDGTRLYATVGSNSDHGERGLPVEEGRAAIYEIDLASGEARIYASGLRNPNGLAWEPGSEAQGGAALWTVVNERDELGSDLVPDYLTAVQEGAFYGWPFSYWGEHVDTRVSPQNPALVARATRPDYALGNHTASLGLAFAEGALLPPRFRDGAFIGQHGSWNREPPSGYAVVFVPFENGRPAGPPVDVLTGFRSPDDEAYGRPVGVGIDAAGALLVADDVGNTIWRVTPAAR